jgi:hypothetical protein
LPARFAGLVAVLFGLATLSYTRHPEGFLDYLAGRFELAMARRHGHRFGPGTAGGRSQEGAAGTGVRAASGETTGTGVRAASGEAAPGVVGEPPGVVGPGVAGPGVLGESPA